MAHLTAPKPVRVFPGTVTLNNSTSRCRETRELRFRDLVARQLGAVAHYQLLDLGYSQNDVNYRVRTGQLRRARPKVFVLAGSTPSWERDVTVAYLWAGPSGVVSHRCAASLLKLEGVPPGTLEITMPRGRRRSAEDVVVHRRDDLVGYDIMRRGHLRITSPTRTLIDIAAVVPKTVLEEALEDGLRRQLTTLERLSRRLGQLGGRRVGSSALMDLLMQRDPALSPTESGLETRVDRALRTGRLPPFVRQYEISDGMGFNARVDFAYPEAKLAIEAQSYKHHSGRMAWLRDMDRDRRLRRLGWIVLYIAEEDLRTRKAEVLQEIRDILAKRAPHLLRHGQTAFPEP